MRSVGALRENNPTRIALETFGRARPGALGNLEIRGSVAHARGGTHQHGGLVLLRKVVGGAHHLASLLGRCRVEHRHLGECRKTARILLGLGRNGARIVGHVQNSAAFHAHIVQRHQRIAGNVQAHLLAGVQRARARIGSACQQLQGRLFVRGPLNVNAFGTTGGMLFCHCFDDLGRRRAWVSGAHTHTRFKSGMGECLVARQKFFCH